MAHILIVEDDRKTAELIGRRLSAAGHQYSVESSGANVVEVVKNGGHDLLILDVMLPGVSGFEICRRIRRDTDLYTLPILILSIMSGDEEVKHGLAQGADDYVVKPFDINNLIHRVEALLRATTESNITDPLTSLPGADGTKRELQKKVSRQVSFALAYVELAQLREYGWHHGQEARDKTIRHLARALVQCGQGLNAEQFFVGHMGGGCFVCVLPPDTAEAYCNQVRSLWQQHLCKLNADVPRDRERLEEPGQEGPPPLDTLFYVTFRDAKDNTTPQRMFEVLSQIRNRARAAKSSGVFVDQRTVS